METKKTTSEAQKKASLKWERANTEKITIKLRVGTKPSREEIRAAAATTGGSMNAWIIGAIMERMEGRNESGQGAEIGADVAEALTIAERAGQAAGVQPGPWLLDAAKAQEQRDRTTRLLLTQQPTEKGAQ